MSTENLTRIDARIKLTGEDRIVNKRTSAEQANGATKHKRRIRGKPLRNVPGLGPERLR